MSDNSEFGLYKFYLARSEDFNASPDLRRFARLWVQASDETKQDLRVGAIKMKQRWESKHR